MNELEELKKEVNSLKTSCIFTYAMLACILIMILILFSGCTTIGTASKENMVNKWKDKPVTENLLADINGWGNWYKKSNPLEPGNCVPQTTVKANILKELGIPYKIVHCTIVRDAYKPVGHRFLIAWAENEWKTMDNGSVCNAVFPYEAVKKAAWGVINYQVEE